MDEVRAGVRGANRVTTRGRRNRLRCRWRPRGSSCPKVGALVSVAGQGRNRWSEQREPTAREIWDWTGARDNKSVAEIGAKHLLTAGWKTPRCPSTAASSVRGRPITVTGGWRADAKRVFRLPRGETIKFRRRVTTPSRKIWIDPIKDVLVSELVDPNRLAGELSWFGRHSPMGLFGES